jgi:cyanophycin synthetase
MDISRIRALRGPNLWTRQIAIEAIVRCEPDERAIDSQPEFEAALRERFPQLDPWPQRPDGLSLAHALKRVALALRAQAGCPVTFARCTETLESGPYQVVVEYTEEAVGRAAFDAAERLIAAVRAPEPQPFDVDAVLAQLRELDQDIRLGPSTGAIVNAALARGIAFRHLTQGSLALFGWGAKQRCIWAAEVDGTSAVAESIAQDKELTKQLLRAAGVPVPRGRPVDSVEEAWAVAQEIGLPVVVKPRDGNQGKGVSVNIVDREHLDIAYRAALQHGQPMVERFLPGSDFRLLVVGNRLIAAARRDPPQVIGDGVHSVAQLIEQVNADPLRDDGHATPLTKMRIDEIVLARLKVQHHTPQTVPAKGERVVLRNNANLSTGGTATDVTDDVYPEVAARAVAAARMIGLDICGVDVVCETMLRPLEEQRGGIVEVNAAPGLRMHISPSYGTGRAVGEAIVDHLFAPGDNGRVPVASVTGTNGKTTTARLIAHLLKAQGLRVGMANTDGVYVNGRQTDSGDCSGPRSARNVLMHPEVDAAVLETARGGILREGLGFD